MKKGDIILVRSNMAGGFFGTLESKENNTVLLSNARRISYWEGAYRLEEIAENGLISNNCRLTKRVSEIEIFDICQILLCTTKAIKNLDILPEWTIQK